jgi:hypothetical protein
MDEKQALRILLNGFHFEYDGDLYWDYIEGVPMENIFGKEFQDYCINKIKEYEKEPKDGM